MNNKAFYNLTYGVFLLATKAGEKANACIVNTGVQVAGSPVRVAVSVLNTNYTCALIKESGRFTLSALDDSCSFETIKHFGTRGRGEAGARTPDRRAGPPPEAGRDVGRPLQTHGAGDGAPGRCETRGDATGGFESLCGLRDGRAGDEEAELGKDDPDRGGMPDRTDRAAVPDPGSRIAAIRGRGAAAGPSGVSVPDRWTRVADFGGGPLRPTKINRAGFFPARFVIFYSADAVRWSGGRIFGFRFCPVPR